MELMNKLWAAAKADKRRIVLPEGDEERTIKATGKIVELGLAKPVLVGDENVIRSKAKDLDVDLTGVEVVDPNKSDRLEAYISAFYELRKNKGMTMEKAEELVEDEKEAMYQDLVKRMSMQGITEELYLKYTNSKEEDLIEKMKDEAKKRIQYRYLLREIIKKENIKITDKEAKEKIKEIAKQYNVTEEEILKEVGTLEAMKMDLAFQKAVELVKANND